MHQKCLALRGGHLLFWSHHVSLVPERGCELGVFLGEASISQGHFSRSQPQWQLLGVMVVKGICSQ